MYRFPTPRDPRVGAWGAPNTPKSPPSFLKKKLVGKINLEIFRLPLFLRFKTPGRCFLRKKNSVTKNFPHILVWECPKAFRPYRLVIPGSPVICLGFLLKHEAILVALAISYNCVLELIHHFLRCLRHQLQRTIVIRLYEFVNIWKSLGRKTNSVEK